MLSRISRPCVRALTVRGAATTTAATPSRFGATTLLARPMSSYASNEAFALEHEHVSPEAQFGYQSTDSYFDENQRAADYSADPTNRAFSYVMSGTSAFMYASVGRVAVNKFVAYLSASSDVMALASMEVDISGVAEGSALTVKWRGKPVFIRHRTAKEIAAARSDDNVPLRDQETDADRFAQNDKYAILIGVCTHLGCVPMNAAGDYNGWFCPCHGSHYDTSGRIRKGPAPANLVVPPYKFLSDTKVLLG